MDRLESPDPVWLYPCKFSDKPCYDKTKLSCIHGGATSCKKWQFYTNQELSGYRGKD